MPRRLQLGINQNKIDKKVMGSFSWSLHSNKIIQNLNN